MTSDTVERRLQGASHRNSVLILAVTVNAPAHGERLNLSNSFHLLNLPVALCAIDAGRTVGTVIEIDEVGQLVDSIPDDRLQFPTRVQSLVQSQSEEDFLYLA
jgi:hypothetical protein